VRSISFTLLVSIFFVAACSSIASAEIPLQTASDAATSDQAINLSTLTGRIAFSTGEPHAEDVYIINADGSGLTQVTTDPAADFDPTWSPEGSRLRTVTSRGTMKARISM
jgi:hypothetical protein